MPKYLKAGASEVVTVPGLRSSVIHGFVIDSKDNFFFCQYLFFLFIIITSIVHITSEFRSIV